MVWEKSEAVKQENRLDSDESRRFLCGAGNGNRTHLLSLEG